MAGPSFPLTPKQSLPWEKGAIFRLVNCSWKEKTKTKNRKPKELPSGIEGCECGSGVKKEQGF